MDVKELIKELKYEAYMFGVSPYAKLYQRAADALEALDKENQALKQTLKADIT